MTLLANYKSTNIFNSETHTFQVDCLDEQVTLSKTLNASLVEKIHEEYFLKEDDKDSAILLGSLQKPLIITVRDEIVGIVDILDKYCGNNAYDDIEPEFLNDDATDITATIYVNAIIILKEFRGRGYSSGIADAIAKSTIKKLVDIKKMHSNMDEIEVLVDGDIISESGGRFCRQIASSIDELKNKNKILDCKFHLEFCACP